MENKLKRLLDLLDKKEEKGSLLPYEEGIRDILISIVHKDIEDIDEMIEEYSQKND